MAKAEISLAGLLSKEYCVKTYTCFDFLLDAWRWAYTEPLDLPMQTRLDLLRNIRLFTKVRKEDLKDYGFRTLVVMGTGSGLHIGLLHSAKVLHLNHHGAEYCVPSLATRGFEKVRYYHYAK